LYIFFAINLSEKKGLEVPLVSLIIFIILLTKNTVTSKELPADTLTEEIWGHLKYGRWI
jgi:hypothetical protein